MFLRFLHKMNSNTRAEQGIREILSKLDQSELLSLAATVTQGLLKNKLESNADAIEAILKYSPDLQSILRRRIVTREILFAYAHKYGAPVILPATKNDLVDTLCQFWDLKTFPSPTDVGTIDNTTSIQQLPQQFQQEASSLDVTVLAIKFCEWFYTMMNSDKPIGAEHFWEDAKLRLNLFSATNEIYQVVDESTEEISRVLFKTKCEHYLYFNPNFLNDGIGGRIDPHGLVVVLACGTLHANNACVGVFEQVFMLARDPFSDNNWKIKNTELNLRNKEVRNPPSLCDNSLTSNLLALPKS
ncbi:hypothetical protein ILUMI_27017 [Ignelater luminosus]|uniref:NTF2 domain-containing protein n=1 Tax=Ignelater luminosus TaxID=2038154 RepID=A0A8K0FVT0_IGNLU|nr:hypothetical protein ILUMI_27017 [Ignelater luminosus]